MQPRLRYVLLAGLVCSAGIALAQLPVVNEGGVVDNATFAGPASEGSFAAIFGTELASELLMADSVPLSTSLGGVSVTFNGVPAPLLGGNQFQLAVQVPFGLSGQALSENGPPGPSQATTMAQVVVSTPAGSSAPVTSPIQPASPGIWTVAQNGMGQGWVLFANTLITAAPVGALDFLGLESRPATAGDALTIFCSGLGAVAPPIEAGRNSFEPDGSLVVRETVNRPVITVGGVTVPDENLIFSGLSPPFVALYQINFVMPAGVAPSDAVPIQIQIGEFISPDTVTIAVQ